MWIFEFSLGVCLMELRSLVSSLGNLVSNGKQVLLGGIRLGSSAIVGSKDEVVVDLEKEKEKFARD